MFSQRGREDLRGQLSAMRKLAWRLGWLDRSIDPLDGLEIARANVLHGATAQYVDPRRRPETRQVKAMAAAADRLGVSKGVRHPGPPDLWRIVLDPVNEPAQVAVVTRRFENPPGHLDRR